MASISSLFTLRHSSRSYDPTRKVAEQQIKLLIEAASLAPSSYNEQPWNFIFCDRSTHLEAYNKALSCLVEFNQNWAKNAPVLVIAVASSQSEKTKQPNRWGTYDTGAAAVCMALEAADLGLSAHQMGGFDEAKIRKEFNIPSEFIPMSVMAIGYDRQTGDTSCLAKERRPIQENFFSESWGKPFNVSK